MLTIQNPNHPTGIIEIGDSIILYAVGVDISPIEVRFIAFRKVHVSYSAAEVVVQAAMKALATARDVASEDDDDLNQALDTLASELAASGLPRINPFKPLGFASPSAIKVMAQEDKTKDVHDLVVKAKAYPGATKKAVTAANTTDRAATTVEKSAKLLPPLEKAQALAIKKRDALAPLWEKEFSALKHAATTADDEGAGGLYKRLFQDTAKAEAKGAKTVAQKAAKKVKTAAKKTEKQAKKAKKAKKQDPEEGGAGSGGAAPPSNGPAA